MKLYIKALYPYLLYDLIEGEEFLMKMNVAYYENGRNLNCIK